MRDPVTERVTWQVLDYPEGTTLYFERSTTADVGEEWDQVIAALRQRGLEPVEDEPFASIEAGDSRVADLYVLRIAED